MSTAEDIKNKIWAMANELRGNMDASEYRDYILGFMFYRFLSEHQLNWQSENEEYVSQRHKKRAAFYILIGCNNLICFNACACPCQC